MSNSKQGIRQGRYGRKAGSGPRACDAWRRYFDGAKTLALLDDADSPTLMLGLDADVEYQGKSPAQDAAWPHLLVEQDLTAPAAQAGVYLGVLIGINLLSSGISFLAPDSGSGDRSGSGQR